MFFCNPCLVEKNDGDDDNDQANKIRFLIDNDKLSWLSPFSPGGVGDWNVPGLKSTGSCSTAGGSTAFSFDGMDDFVLDSSTREMFFDAASSDAIFRSRKRPLWNTKRRKQLLIFSITLGILVFGLWYYHYDDETINFGSLMESFKDATIWVKSAAVRIWDELIPSYTLVKERISLFLELSNKIDNAILSLFRWDEVDDAIVDWIQRAILYMWEIMLDIGRETATFLHGKMVDDTPSTNNYGPTCAQQALALLDLIQDAEP